ncbi:MAG: hypothetical protein H6734_28115 [Alphaproteobacteria bacterium]|nr:hypothetical protein [Alphaproteobacteria bacterium]
MLDVARGTWEVRPDEPRLVAGGHLITPLADGFTTGGRTVRVPGMTAADRIAVSGERVAATARGRLLLGDWTGLTVTPHEVRGLGFGTEGQVVVVEDQLLRLDDAGHVLESFQLEDTQRKGAFRIHPDTR